jgi:D-arabinono-1,4-lactone oxidase
MLSRTFADRNVKWHAARLSASLAGIVLCLCAALTLLASSLAVILSGELRAAVLLPEWALSIAMGGAGALWLGHARLADALRHKRTAVAGAAIGALLGLLDAPFLANLLSEGIGSRVNLLHASICVIALASSLRAMGVYWTLRSVCEAPAQTARHYPETEQEIIDLVRKARETNVTLRVVGSAHSVYRAIAASRGIDVSLARFNRIVEWDDTNRRVRVQAGCVLGVDPASPTSTRQNSLLHQLERRGWALPLTGGITHQTVAGFLATGSSGGSVTHSLGDCIEAIRLIDGTGEVRDLAPHPEDPDDELHNPFYAAGVSLGLLGIITEVTFQCQERFDISGEEITSALPNAAIQLFEDGDRGLGSGLRRIEYCRLMWWPQRGIERLQVWEGSRVGATNGQRVQPYVQIPGGRLAQILLAAYFRFANRSSRRTGWMRRLMTLIMHATIPNGRVSFRGPWLSILPMDNEVDNDLLPVSFSELWIDLDQATEVARTLGDHYSGDTGFQHTGSFACELYGAKKSRFWLSPSYGRDTIRVDLMHLDQGRIRPETEYFPQFWSLLERFEPRYHWGKQMPPSGRAAGASYFARVYPRWSDFLNVRAKLDPDNLFVNDYWRHYFQLSQSNRHAAPVHPDAPRSTAASGRG